MFARVAPWVALAAVACVASCTAASKPGKWDPLSDDADADIFERVLDRGPLVFGVPAEGELTADRELHAYRLSVRRGARVSIENTRAGTDDDLDSVLYVFGPWDGDGYGHDALAMDDDGGTGELAHIMGFIPERGGEYLVVLTSFDGKGRGAYRLASTCDSGACEFVELPALADACDSEVRVGVESCVSAAVGEGGASSSVGPAIRTCVEADALVPLRDGVCQSAPSTPFCGLDDDVFVAYMAPACLGEVALGMRADALGLGEEEPSTELKDAVSSGCGVDCDLEVHVYGYPAAVVATLDAAVGASLERLGEDYPAASTDVRTESVAIESGVQSVVDAALKLSEAPHAPHDVGLLTVPNASSELRGYVVLLYNEHKVVVIEVRSSQP